MTTKIVAMHSLADYPAGLIGTVSALFGRTIGPSHGVDWTLDAMLAEEQIAFFRCFDPTRDRVWVAMDGDCPAGAITIEGPRPELGEHAARLRFFILDKALRGRGLGNEMMLHAMCFCKEKQYKRVFLTTLPGLEAAMRLYEKYGFRQVGQSGETFHGSRFAELRLETNIE